MEAALLVSALAALAASVFPRGKAGRLPAALCFAGMYAALLVNFVFGGAPVSPDGLLSSNNVFGCIIIICAALSAQMSFAYFEKRGRAGLANEFVPLLMICAAALILFVRSNNLAVSFVALECATVCLYILSAFNRGSASSLQAGVKYIIIGGVSGAVFLMGMALMYGAGRLAGADFLSLANFSAAAGDRMFMCGFVLVLCAVLFKTAAFPFQFWAPDVYQGAPTPVSAFLAVASKSAGIVFFAKICASLNFDSAELMSVRGSLLSGVCAVSALTIIVGNLGGITQLRTKRLLAFSGISNAGYLLVLIAALLKNPRTLESLEAVLYFYLGAYMLANYALFFAVAQFEGDDTFQSLADYRGVVSKYPATGVALIVNLASLAGIPPTAGFFGKLLVMILAWYAQLYWLLGVMVAGSAASIYYYFAWIRAMLEKREGGEAEFSPGVGARQTIVVLAVAVVCVSVFVFSFAGA